MKAIGSSSSWYNVHVRGMQKPLKMSVDGGQKLSAYLEKEPGMFVHIKDTSGNEYTIRTMTIDRVEKSRPAGDMYKTAEELRLPELSDGSERKWR